MKAMVEINRLSILINKELVNSGSKAFMLSEGVLPVIGAPYKLGLAALDWSGSEQRGMPEEYTVVFAGEVTHPDWSVRSKTIFHTDVKWCDQILRSGVDLPFKLQQIILDDESQFIIDNHEVNLTPAINQILAENQSRVKEIGTEKLHHLLMKTSKKRFGSDLIPDLIFNHFYQITGQFNGNQGEVFFTAAYNQEHFEESSEAPPYLFLKFPTCDLEYFVRHFDWPGMKIKGYEIKPKSLEVISDNGLVINIVEVNKGWDIKLKVLLEIRRNMILLNVQSIQADGLNLLERALFNIFKGLLVQQIEKKEISVAEIYHEIKSDFESRYPFLQIQPGHLPALDALKLDLEQTELMIHFDQKRTE